MLVFKQRRSVPYVVMDLINQELDRMKWIGVILKVQYSEWAAPTLYIKKNKHICVYAYFLIGLNEYLNTYEYLFPSTKGIFAKLSSKIFSKIKLSEVFLQVMVMKKFGSCLQLTLRGLYSFWPFIIWM